MSDDRLKTAEAVWALVARILGFVAGIVLGSILVLSKSEIVWAYLLVVVFIGPVAANSMASMLAGLRGVVNGGKDD